jgi:hypothetical protein
MQTLPPSDDPKVSRSQAVPTDFLGRAAGAILIARQRPHEGSDVRRHREVQRHALGTRGSTPRRERHRPDPEAVAGVCRLLRVRRGKGVGGSVTLFEDRGKANAANEKALAWIRGSLFDLIEGDPEIIAGEVLAEVLA